MNKDFTIFQKEFKKYQRLFGLAGYRVYFKHEKLDEKFAEIRINHGGLVATVVLNKELSEKDVAFKDVRADAKHEALHLLIGRLCGNAKYRHATLCEIDEAAEELVIKLEELIKEK